jgi:M protein repeat family protein
MAVSKFYAVWRKESGEEETVNAFQALALKGRAQIVTTPKEQATLFDLETGLKVNPRSSQKKDGRYVGQPYFSYYPGEESPLKGLESSFEYSSELNAFIEAFKTIEKFQIEYDNHTAYIFPKAISPMQRIVFEDEDFVILKLLIDIDETYPYSEYYRLNGQLGIEFYKTSRPEPVKRIKLAKEGIPLFEAKAHFPKSTKIYVPEEFTSPEQVKSVADRVRKVYQETNYKLYGNFDKYHIEAFVFLDDNERKYHTLKTYEEQCQELEAEIKQLEACFSQKDARVNQLREEIKQAEIRLRYYCEKEEYYKKLEKDNELLKQEKAQLRTERQQLTEQSRHLREERDAAQEETKSLKNRTWWQRLFNRY